MAVAAVNLTIDKGTDFSITVKVKKDGAVIDLTDYVFNAKMRKHYAAQTSYEFTVTPSIPYDRGIVTVGMASSISTNIPIGRYYYDLLIERNSIITKAFEGTVIVKGTAS
jgi:hypothetical protein